MSTAVVIGSGPNGLAAAVTLARAGWSVTVLEAGPEPGGSCRSGDLFGFGTVHDRCASVHPLGAASPAFRQWNLERHGLRWAHPAIPVGHVLDPGRATWVDRSVADTAARLGADGDRWRRLFDPLNAQAEPLVERILRPLAAPDRAQIRAAGALARFAEAGLGSAARLAGRFAEPDAPALLGGLAAHAVLPLEASVTAGVALMFATVAHAVGFPVAVGGSGRIVAALVAELESLGGRVECDHRVDSLDDLPPVDAVLCDLAPQGLVRVAGDRLPVRYRQALQRFRHGPGVCKVDYVLDGPVPWAEPALAGAGTVHLTGTFDHMAEAMRQVAAGRVADRPVVLFGQPAAADPTRDHGNLTAVWAYCHVPSGFPGDVPAIDAQVERAAPGFRDRVVARQVTTAVELEARNANLIGGDITGGANDLRQLWTRPTVSARPWRTPVRGLYLCSSSTPPGGGVHGMCGVNAAETVLADHRRSTRE